MAQHDYILANQSGAAFRSDLNNGLAAIVSQNSGAAQPSTTYAYQWWADTATGLLKIRNAANNAWITLFQLDGEWTTLALENGTAAAPSLYFKDSGTDTGLFSPGANQLAISTGGVQRLLADASGNLTASGGLTVANLNGGPLAGFRNRIINGNFDFWQRGTSFTLSTSFQYTADRWRAKVGTGGAGSLVRNISATNNPYLTLAITTAGTGSHELGQPIEFVRSVTGDGGASTSVSVSFNLAITSGTGTVDVSLLQYFGSGGSPSGSVSLSLGTITPTGTRARYTLSGTLASIAGKTFGTNNDDQLVLIFTPSNAVATYDFSAIQVEPGTVATPFEHRSYGQELALCQRYYYQPGSSYTEQSYGTGAGANTFTQIYFPTQMRANPTITAAWSGGVNAVGSAITALGAIGATATLASFAGGDFAAVITWTSFSAEL